MIISFITGSNLKSWFNLLKKIKFKIYPQYLHRALFITVVAAVNSLLGKREKKFTEQVSEVTIKDGPVFIIGCWRSGTTLLHNLIAQDERFGYLDTTQALFPYVFLSSQKILENVLVKTLPKTRPQDNVKLSATSPQEDEIALAAMTPYNVNHTLNFPMMDDEFYKYMDFKNVGSKEIEIWSRSFEKLVKKVTLSRKNKTLVLKSPSHTARMRYILDIFPQAKFIHIIRNPYDVYNSLKGFVRTLNSVYLKLQPMKKGMSETEWALMTYEKLYDAYFVQLPQIPKEKIYVVKYEDLLKDPVTALRKIYKTMSLPDFKAFEPRLKEYLQQTAKFKNNKYDSISREEMELIHERWKRFFKEWGYPMKKKLKSKAK